MLRLLLLVTLLGAFSWSQALVKRTQIHMATFTHISLPLEQEKFFEPSFEIIKSIDQTFSTYKSTAIAYQLNKDKKHRVSELFLELLQECQTVYKQTQAYFSIAIGSITRQRYHFGEQETKIPSHTELDSARTNLLGYIIDGNEVRLEKGVTLDFGGIAKGFAVDKVRLFLEKQKVEAFEIALSGDIYCKGSCKIAIQSPFAKNKILKVLKLRDSAVSTSGNYERFIQSKKHNHLINPKTKRSQQEIASMTLYSRHVSNTKLDALATALSVMPMKKRLALLSKLTLISYVFVTVNGEIYGKERL